MITLQITTSVETLTFTIDVPVSDTVVLHYNGQCKYCDIDICTDTIHRNSREYCAKASHRVAYCEKKMALAAR